MDETLHKFPVFKSFDIDLGSTDLDLPFLDRLVKEFPAVFEDEASRIYLDAIAASLQDTLALLSDREKLSLLMNSLTLVSVSGAAAYRTITQHSKGCKNQPHHLLFARMVADTLEADLSPEQCSSSPSDSPGE